MRSCNKELVLGRGENRGSSPKVPPAAVHTWADVNETTSSHLCLILLSLLQPHAALYALLLPDCTSSAWTYRGGLLFPFAVCFRSVHVVQCNKYTLVCLQNFTYCALTAVTVHVREFAGGTLLYARVGVWGEATIGIPYERSVECKWK